MDFNIHVFSTPQTSEYMHKPLITQVISYVSPPLQACANDIISNFL